MTAKKIIVSVALIFSSLEWSSAVKASDIDEAWVMKQAFQKATEYARSISCDTGTDEKNLVALVPWKNFEDFIDRESARYALVWWGDIGCDGGTGAVNPHIAIVYIGTGSNFFVDPGASSPLIKFETQIRDIRVIKATENELTLSGLDWGPNDPHCCPSIPVRVRLMEDSQGNWKLIEKTQEDR